MALTIVIGNVTPGGDIDNASPRFEYVLGTITPSGSYTTGGDTLNFTAETGLQPGVFGIHSSAVPIQVSVWGVNGYGYGYVKGTTQANGKIKVTTTSNTELAAGAYPAGVTGDTISFFAIFPKQ